MTYHGTVQNGLVVLEDSSTLPDGTLVSVVPVIPAVPEPAADDARTIWQKLADLGRQVESEPCDLPSDLAANHDYYLHGLPKRQGS
ncbi:MAG: hypothetical protein WD851_19075 [Pirellulales bacterium]